MSYKRQRDRASDPDASSSYLAFAIKKSRFTGQWGVRVAIAQNPSTSIDLLRNLAEDSSHQVRAAVAGNSRTPAQALAQIASGERLQTEIMRALAKNPNTPADSLTRLAALGYDKEVLGLILEHANFPPSGWRDFIAHQRSNLTMRYELVVSTRATPDFVYEQLLARTDVDIRQIVASGPCTPASYLKEIVQDQRHPVVLAALQNRNMPLECLETMAQSESFAIRKAIWWHQNASAALLDAMARDWRNRCSDFRAAVRIRRDVSPALKALVEGGGEWDRDHAFDSEVEWRFWEAHAEARKPELQGLVSQYVTGGYRLDFAIPDVKVGIEIDGRAYHSSQEAFTRDRQRERELELQGWRILRFAASEVLADAPGCVTQAATWVRAIT